MDNANCNENTRYKAEFTMKDAEYINHNHDNLNVAQGRNNASALNKFSTNYTSESHKRVNSMVDPPQSGLKEDFINLSQNNIFNSPRKENNHELSRNTQVYSPIANNQMNKSRNSSMISIANEVESVNLFRTQYNNSLKTEGMREFSNLKSKLRELEMKITAISNGKRAVI